MSESEQNKVAMVVSVCLSQIDMVAPKGEIRPVNHG